MNVDSILVNMVKGIETDSKNLKKIKKKDEKWLAEDLNEIRKIAENHIDRNRPSDEEELDKTITKSTKKAMPFARMIAFILGIIGIFTLVFGIYSMTQEINILSIINTLIGAVFLISFILFEKYG